MGNTFEDILKKTFGEQTVELSLDDLAGVAGGSYTQEEETTLRNALIAAKQSGMSKETVLGYVNLLYNSYHKDHPNVTKQEVIDYINQNWDSL